MTNSHDNPSAADILRIAVMYNGSPMSMHFSFAGLAADKSNQGDGTEAAWDPEAVYTGQTAGSLLEDMKRHQHSGPVWIGLVFHNESSSPEVLEVKSDSPAAGAGLQKGDVITAMNGTEIESLGDLIESIHHLAAGEPSKVRVLRGLEEKEVEMTPQFAGTVPESR